MGRNLFTIIILLLSITCQGLSEAGQEILAIQSVRVKPYEEAIKGFESACNSKTKRLVLSDLEEVDLVKEVKKIGPDLIVAIGMDALSSVKRIRNIPVVYLMVLNPASILSGEKNVTGVRMNVSQEKQLITLTKVLPEVKSIGLLYDPDRTGTLVKRAQDAAGKIGIKLIAKKVYSPTGVPSLVRDMKGKIDLFWMLPDITVVTPETFEFLLGFSLEHKIPVLTFSDKYVELGALMSIGVDAFDMGSQAGEMARMILSGRDPSDVPQVDARKAVISINLKIARKLGIHIDEKILRGVRIIYWRKNN